MRQAQTIRVQETSNDGMGKRQTVTVGRERFLVRPWHSEPHVAYLTASPGTSAPSVNALRACLDEIQSKGYTSVITSALHVSETESFIRSGFEEFDRLTVLAHDLRDLDPPRRTPPQSLTIRRARHEDRTAALNLDQQAFPSFWRLDEEGLNEALGATARTRFRVARVDGVLVGYSVTGRAMKQGFLQRLAASPSMMGIGIGSALVVDALRWCRRRNAGCVLVNTQSTNARALALYGRLGFRVTPSSLLVLTRTLS